MPTYSFRETLDYFADMVKARPAEEDLEAGEVELVVDRLRVLISKGSIEGGLDMVITLGLILQPIRESRLKELATSNFLGINTGGCTLAFDEAGVALQLRVNITPASSPQENWEWLHRLLHVATEWEKNLLLWEEYVSLISEKEGEKR
ncbi:MAG: type III secretion system chaperone [Chlamydiales bacterium]|nr:type III secretion system chaperone [Chlamydiales bacterium]